jgi:peptidoglycan/LPS O-acetylase OafA/YrhL
VLHGLSSLVDLCRALAALVVVVGHLDELGFWPVDTDGRANRLSHDAVVVFFVLSGLAIAHAARVSRHDARGFAIARASRLWSVAVPAVLLTLALDAIGMRLDPSRYTSWQYAHAPLHVAYQWLFLGELWTHGSVVPFSNVPYWSLGYEAWYYALFFAAAFLRGRARLVAVAVLLAVMGPKLWLLLPAWLAGVWTQRRLEAIDAREAAGAPLAGPAGAALAIVAIVAAASLLAGGGQARLEHAGLAAIGALPDGWQPRLGYSRWFVADWVLAALVAALLVGARLARPRLPAPLARAAKISAGVSFSLYVVHYPVLMLLGAALPVQRGIGWTLLALAVVLAVTAAFWAAFERHREPWRRALGAAWDLAARRLALSRIAR